MWIRIVGFSLVACWMVVGVHPHARANDFWGGAAVGVGSTLLFQGVRNAYQEKKREEKLEEQRAAASTSPAPHHQTVQEQLEMIKKYCDQGLFTPDECSAKRQQILNAL